MPIFSFSKERGAEGWGGGDKKKTLDGIITALECYPLTLEIPLYASNKA